MPFSIGPDGDDSVAATTVEPLSLQSILDSIQDIFYRVDRHGTILIASRSCAAELGYGSPDEVIGQKAEALSASPERRQLMMDTLLREGLVRDFELLLRRKDGSVITIATTVHLLRDALGRPAGYQGIWRNISQRKRDEERVRQSEEKFSLIFRTVPDTLVVTRASDGLLLDVNPGFEAATGWRREEAIGRSTLSLGLWVDPVAREQMVVDLREKGEVLYRDFTFARKDGEHRDGLFSARMMLLGGERQVLFMMRDITERLRERQALWREEQRFRQAIEGASLGTWDWRAKTNEVLINDRWARMLGFERAELPNAAGIYQFWEERIHPDDHPLVTGSLREHLRGAAPTYEVEHRLRHKSGSWVWVLTTGRVLERDKDGAALLVSGTHQDITERRRLAEEHDRMELQLRQSQKLDAIGQLAGGVAHDFNNLLTVQLGNLELVELSPDLPQDVREMLAEVARSAKAAAALTRQLLAFSRRQLLRMQRIDLNDVVGNFLRMLRRVMREDVKLHFEPSGQPLWVDADVGLLEQVIMNLAVNARDAMPNGGRLRLECAPVEVPARRELLNPDARPGAHARLDVADTGEGMDEETQRRIFEPFFTTKPVGQGTGLGLATVYGIVKQHGGWIDVASSPGVGSVFSVHFPRQAAPQRSAGTAPDGTPARGQGERVLLVEDDPSVRATLRAWLERLGYRTLEARTGDEAVGAWRTGGGADLVLTDLVMPGATSGHELVARLRAEHPDLPIVVMSGYSPVLGARGLPDGVGFLQKPCEPAELARSVRRALDRL
jgi:PAS domain S-box-containing protein